MANHWCATGTLPPLAAQDIHVWRVNLRADAAQVARCLALLSADERARAARYHFTRDRDSFVVCRGALRSLLGAYLGCAAASIVFCYGPYGKPALAAPHPMLQFNSSHSGDLALIALARTAPVGIDVELMRPDVVVMDLVERFFSPAEVAGIGTLAADQQHAAFYSCWTRKEAYVKARGEGLSLPLDQFTVAYAAATPTILHAAARQWTVDALEIDDGYAAAIASSLPDATIHCWNYQHG